ncbi:unnamed protein product, partial [Mesorhabditis spiculigera]
MWWPVRVITLLLIYCLQLGRTAELAAPAQLQPIRHSACSVLSRPFDNENDHCISLARAPFGIGVEDPGLFLTIVTPGQPTDTEELWYHYGCQERQVFCRNFYQASEHKPVGCYSNTRWDPTMCHCERLNDTAAPILDLEASLHLQDLYSSYMKTTDPSDPKSRQCLTRPIIRAWELGVLRPKIVLCDVTTPYYSPKDGCKEITEAPYSETAVAFYEYIDDLKIVYMCPDKGQVFCTDPADNVDDLDDDDNYYYYYHDYNYDHHYYNYYHNYYHYHDDDDGDDDHNNNDPIVDNPHHYHHHEHDNYAANYDSASYHNDEYYYNYHQSHDDDHYHPYDGLYKYNSFYQYNYTDYNDFYQHNDFDEYDNNDHYYHHNH